METTELSPFVYWSQTKNTLLLMVDLKDAKVSFPNTHTSHKWKINNPLPAGNCALYRVSLRTSRPQRSRSAPMDTEPVAGMHTSFSCASTSSSTMRRQRSRWQITKSNCTYEKRSPTGGCDWWQRRRSHTGYAWTLIVGVPKTMPKWMNRRVMCVRIMSRSITICRSRKLDMCEVC